jgi:hypothetical protein
VTFTAIFSIELAASLFAVLQKNLLGSRIHAQLLDYFSQHSIWLWIPLVSAVTLAPLSTRLLEKLRFVFKDRIFFHRAYKKLPHFSVWTVAKLLLLVGILDVLIFIYHRELTHGFVMVVRGILLRCGIYTELLYYPFLPVVIKNMPILDSALVFPSFRLALYNLVIALVIIVILPRLYRLPRAIVVYTVLLSLLIAASAVFFLLVPHRFPYDISDFSMLYMGTQLGMWLLMPLVLAIVLAPLPAYLLEKLLIIFLTVTYSVIFGAIRFAALLYLLNKVTVLYMAAMFFALGPLIDFFYVVAIYSVYVNILSLRLQKAQEIWRWLF